MIAGRGLEHQRRPRRYHVQPAAGVEQIGKPEQVALVGSASVVEDEQTVGNGSGGPLEEGERGGDEAA
ncbi:MAG TPA: hypothetical protein VFS48_08460 [Solirubrobacterales bacterium]|nr:hypothetical protein [Solirubrobacterales bacterium]